MDSRLYENYMKLKGEMITTFPSSWWTSVPVAKKQKSTCEWCFIISAICVMSFQWLLGAVPDARSNLPLCLKLPLRPWELLPLHAVSTCSRPIAPCPPPSSGIGLTQETLRFSLLWEGWTGQDRRVTAPCLAAVHYGEHRGCKLWLQFRMFSQLLMTSCEFQWLWAAVWVISD